MNAALTQMAADCGLASDAHTPLRMAFGLACVQRVRHLLEDPEAIAAWTCWPRSRRARWMQPPWPTPPRD